jgi:hypothetical protein
MGRNVCDRLRRVFPVTLSLLLLTALASCQPLFTHPLPPPRELKADNQILGTWTTTFKVDKHESKAQLSIFPRGSGWIDAMYIYDIDCERPGDGLSFLVFEGYSTSVNKQRFLCLRLQEKYFNWAQLMGYSPSDKGVGEPPLLKYWIIVNYETPNSDELIMRQFSTEKLEGLIKQGHLKGQVQTGEPFPHTRFDGQRLEDLLREKGLSLKAVIVTSSAQELSEVIGTQDIGAFLGQGTFDTLVFSRGAVQYKATE